MVLPFVEGSYRFLLCSVFSVICNICMVCIDLFKNFRVEDLLGLHTKEQECNF